MSFSPDINEYGYAHANIFAWNNYSVDRPPYPDYLVATIGTDYGSLADGMLAHGQGDITGLDFTKQPLYFPTLEVMGAGLGLLAAPFIGNIYDYLIGYNSAVLNKTPILNDTTSGFFDWDSGFGFGISNAVHAYNDAPLGTSGESTHEATLSVLSALTTPGHETLTVYGYNCEDAVEYIKSEINQSPFVTVCVTRQLAADASVPDSYSDLYEDPGVFGDVSTADFGVAGVTNYVSDYQQVLFKTSVVLMSPSDAIVYDSEGFFATPESPLAETDPQLKMTEYPKVISVNATNDGSFKGDLKLFEAPSFEHRYDSDYTHVKEDIRTRFKSSGLVIQQRNEYIEQKIDKYTQILKATFDIPRGMRSRKQAAPKMLRDSYTTFDYDDTIAVTSQGESMSDTSTPGTTATVSSAGMTGGGGGSY